MNQVNIKGELLTKAAEEGMDEFVRIFKGE